MRLICTSNSASGSTRNAHAVVDQPRERHLVGALDGGDALLQSRVVSVLGETRDRGRIVQHAGAADLAQELGQRRDWPAAASGGT